MPIAAIGLGSNLGEPARTIERALRGLETLGTVTARSALYRSRAWGYTEQPDFLNAAALVRTKLSPRELLGSLQALERQLGRTTTFRWGPRAIDLDILTYGDLVVAEPGLTIPHERLFERAFALGPLAEIDPAFAPAFAALAPGERASVQRVPAEGARNQPSVNWDETLERVRSAAEFCATGGLTRFRIEEQDLVIEVRRRPQAADTAAPADLSETPGTSNGAVSANGSASSTEPPHAVLRAEFVGIVRLSRPPVTYGTQLSEDREVAYVESLGIRNPVRGGPGRIAEVFVSDGQAVEYGQPLFSIER